MITNSVTNPQNETFPNAVLAIENAHFRHENNKSFSLSSDMQAESENDSSGNTLRYRVIYWPSQESYDAEFSPYVLNSVFDGDGEDFRNIEEKLWHEAQGLGEAYMSLSAKEMAEISIL